MIFRVLMQAKYQNMKYLSLKTPTLSRTLRWEREQRRRKVTAVLRFAREERISLRMFEFFGDFGAKFGRAKIQMARLRHLMKILFEFGLENTDYS